MYVVRLQLVRTDMAAATGQKKTQHSTQSSQLSPPVAFLHLGETWHVNGVDKPVQSGGMVYDETIVERFRAAVVSGLVCRVTVTRVIREAL